MKTMAMEKDVSITIPFTDNKETHILLVLSIFLSVKEINLAEAGKQAELFRAGNDMAILITGKNLAMVESMLQSSSVVYRCIRCIETPPAGV